MNTDITLSSETIEKLKKLFSDVKVEKSNTDMFSLCISEFLRVSNQAG